jgi:hypothetical protein
MNDNHCNVWINLTKKQLKVPFSNNLRYPSSKRHSLVNMDRKVKRVSQTMPTFPHIFFAIMALSRLVRVLCWMMFIKDDLNRHAPWWHLSCDLGSFLIPDTLLVLMVIPYFVSVLRALSHAAEIYASGNVSMAQCQV